MQGGTILQVVMVRIRRWWWCTRVGTNTILLHRTLVVAFRRHVPSLKRAVQFPSNPTVLVVAVVVCWASHFSFWFTFCSSCSSTLWLPLFLPRMPLFGPALLSLLLLSLFSVSFIRTNGHLRNNFTSQAEPFSFASREAVDNHDDPSSCVICSVSSRQSLAQLFFPFACSFALQLPLHFVSLDSF